MRAGFELIEANYLLRRERLALKLPGLRHFLAPVIYEYSPTFKSRLFLFYEQKWLLLTCVVEPETLEAESINLKLQLDSYLRIPQSRKSFLPIFGLDVMFALESMRQLLEPIEIEQLANSLGSFDIHLTDYIGELRWRAKHLFDEPIDYANLSLEVATFSHLGKIFQRVVDRYPSAADVLINYLLHRYGNFFQLCKYPIDNIPDALLDALRKDSESVFADEIRTAIGVLKHLYVAPEQVVEFDT